MSKGKSFGDRPVSRSVSERMNGRGGKREVGSGVPCPSCGATKSVVIDTRPLDRGQRKRLRGCVACDYRWNTVEIPLPTYKKLKAAAALLKSMMPKK